MQLTADLAPLFKREFELCKVKEGEVVAVLTESKTRPEYVTAATTAAQMLGAQVFEISVPGMGMEAPTVVKAMAMGVPALSQPSPLLDAVKESLLRTDFIVDLISDTILHIPVREELLEADKRILTVIEPPEALERLFPSPEIKESVLAIRSRLARAETLRLTSPSGTDLRYTLIPGSGISQYGYADEPGHWDHWPSALVSSYPAEGQVDGTLVVSAGDIIFPFKAYAHSPVTLRIEGGYVREIEGGVEADLIRDYLENWNEPEVYAVSHMGIGMHPRAQWTALAFHNRDEIFGMDARSMLGGFIFSTGPNRYIGSWVEAHLDIPLRGTTVELDGETVIRDGKLVPEGSLEASGRG